MTQEKSAASTPSQTEKCLRQLRTLVIAGKWSPGEKLREVALAQDLGVSRTPLRSALLNLEQEGLLVRVGSGYTVRSFSIDEALVAIELRGVVEGTAVRLAAQRIGVKSLLEPIKATLDKLDNVVSHGVVDDYGELNTLFHLQLVALSGSSLIEREVARASRLPFAAPSAFSSDKTDLARFAQSLVIGQQHHHALVEAIERGEGSRAEALAREHAYLAKKNIEIAYQAKIQLSHPSPQLALITGSGEFNA